MSELYNDFIDQLSYVNRIEASDNVHDPASLTVYLSFDNESLSNQGPFLQNELE